MPTFEIEIKILCVKCDIELDSVVTGGPANPGGTKLHVRPCEECLKAEYEKGREQGREDEHDDPSEPLQDESRD